MSAALLSAFVTARPAAEEVAVLYVPAGVAARVHHADGQAREYVPLLPDESTYVVVPGDAGRIGWGAVPCWHPTLRSLRNGRHETDRDAWHAAARVVGEGVVYVRYELVTRYGRPRWTATGIRLSEIGAAA
jgi:hypothetical protein